ncbi:MAG TPA: dethiobiotin synthase, partial [Vampirovibrionales bacterium]
MHFFITGTNTDVGKTFFTALLAKAFVEKGKSVAVFKPVQTGSKPDQLAEDLRFVQDHCSSITVKSSYVFELAATPELSAEKAKIEIDLNKI